MDGMLAAAELGAGSLIGLVVGLLGGGGAVLTLPLLVAGFDVPAAAAATTSLAVVAIASAVGLVVHGRRGGVRWRTGLLVGAAGVAATVVGSLLSARVPGGVLLAGVTVLLVLGGLTMLRPPSSRSRGAGPAAASGERTGVVATLLVGSGVGFVTGFLGVGGGFLVVPVLVAVLRVPTRAAVGTSLVVLLVNAAVGLGTRAAAPPPGVDVTLTVLVSAGAALGAVGGALLSRRIPDRALRRVFGLLLLAVAVVTAVQAAQAWLASAGR